jgi:uncharacterized caspase-like protein
MRKTRWIAAILMMIGLAVVAPGAARAQAGDLRYALVIGNAQYHEKPLATAANDAGLIADTLRQAGFDVTGAADLDQDSVRRAFQDFLTKLEEAGPQAIAFVYLSGYGLQYNGENYFIPVDAFLQRAADIPVQAIRVSDFTQALAGVRLQARIVVLDAARDNVFPTNAGALAIGLALPDVDAGSLYAFNAAPGTVAPEERGTYGVYAQALAEMLRYGGVPIDEVFARTRLRVNQITHGALVPWDVSKLASPLVLLAPPGSDGVPPPDTEAYADLQGEPIHDFTDATDAYAAAVELDTLAGYQEFLAAFPADPLCGRVRALLAHRREALTWSQAHRAHTPNAYWSYMRRYPDGPHAADAGRLLAGSAAPHDPPARFEPYDFQGLAPPEEEERAIIDHADFAPGGPNYGRVPLIPERFLPPLPPQFRHLPPPEPRAEGHLPAPSPIPLVYARPVPRLGNLAAPNFAPQRPSGLPPVPNQESGHALPNPAGQFNEQHVGEEPTHMQSPAPSPAFRQEPAVSELPRPPRAAEVRPLPGAPPRVPPPRNFVVAPHPAAPMRPAGEAR